MNLVRQPEDSNLCGQAVVAMVAGISLEESIKVFGKKGKTWTKDLVAALQALGISLPKTRLTRITKNVRPPQRCIVMLLWRHSSGKRRRHWRLYWDGHTYDSYLGVDSQVRLPEGKVSSYLEIGEKTT